MLDTTTKPKNWRTFYNHRPVSISAAIPSTISAGEAARRYCRWLADARGWTFEQASKYAHAQAPGRIISAQFFGDDSTIAAPRKPTAKVVARQALARLPAEIPPQMADVVAALRQIAA